MEPLYKDKKDAFFAQHRVNSDPICSSAYYPNCFDPSKRAAGDKPVQYNVDHGYPLDGDIITSQKNLADQEKLKKHVWKYPGE
jgi:hypothetical protein